MIGSACAALISVGFGVQATSIGVGGLPGILSIFPQYYLIFLLAMAVAIVIPFVLTLIVGRRKLSAQERGVEASAAESTISEAAAEVAGSAAEVSTSGDGETDTADEKVPGTAADAREAGQAGGVLKAFLSGQAIPLEDVPDDVFSQHIMGDGLAIEPSDETVVAPADATVSAVIEDSRHACGLTLDDGMELLIHVGIDTVDMKGDGFELFVAVGDQVRCGQPLIRFSREKIAAAGHPATTVCIVTDPGSTEHIDYHTGMEVSAGQTEIVTFA